MPLLARFDPPGLLTDLTEAQKAGWSAWISKQMDSAGRSTDATPHNAPRPQFFNATKKEIAADAVEKAVTWGAFPRIVKDGSTSDLQRWQRAEASRDVQDEYCEWSVDTDPGTKKIVRVTFTCEGPEYWEFLAAVNPDKVVELYRKFVNPAVQKKELFRGGLYDRKNQWNNSTTRGCMHLIQDANSLGAEIELAGAASILRQKGGRLLTGEQELIECSQYGKAGRNSDPSIGAAVNEVARLKADVTLKNPVGLYFAGLDTQAFTLPDGSDPKKCWSYVRGTGEFPVRAVFAAPAGKPFVAGDIKISGKPIQFGAQIADHIQMKLTGVGCRIGARTDVSPLTHCIDDPAASAGMALASAPTVEEVLAAAAISRR